MLEISPSDKVAGHGFPGWRFWEARVLAQLVSSVYFLFCFFALACGKLELCFADLDRWARLFFSFFLRKGGVSFDEVYVGGGRGGRVLHVLL